MSLMMMLSTVIAAVVAAFLLPLTNAQCGQSSWFNAALASMDIEGFSNCMGGNKWFNFYNRRLYGTIPSVLGSLSGATTLFLDFTENFLTGTIPSSLGSLSASYTFKGFKFEMAQLTGTIPPSLGSLQRLSSEFYLSLNALSGTIPVSLCRLANETPNFALFNNYQGSENNKFWCNPALSPACVDLLASKGVTSCAQPINCVGNWSAWSECAGTCSGTQLRVFDTAVPELYGGVPCVARNGTSDLRACTPACPTTAGPTPATVGPVTANTTADLVAPIAAGAGSTVLFIGLAVAVGVWFGRRFRVKKLQQLGAPLCDQDADEHQRWRSATTDGRAFTLVAMGQRKEEEDPLVQLTRLLQLDDVSSWQVMARLGPLVATVMKMQMQKVEGRADGAAEIGAAADADADAAAKNLLRRGQDVLKASLADHRMLMRQAVDAGNLVQANLFIQRVQQLEEWLGDAAADSSSTDSAMESVAPGLLLSKVRAPGSPPRLLHKPNVACPHLLLRNEFRASGCEARAS